MKINYEKKKNLFALLLSALGTIYLIYYVFRASSDVVVSDYIRIVNYYLEDVTDLKYLFSWECISRIPITFLCRFINKEYFSYSVFFDKILGIFGIFIFNFVVVKYILNTLNSDKVKLIASLVVSIISFSLMPWEMILNGSGYPHMLTTGLIAVIFYMLDRIVKRTHLVLTLENLDSSDLKFYGNDKENNRLTNMVALIDTSQMQRTNLNAYLIVYLLTIVGSLAFAGSYCVGFLCTLIFFSVIEIFKFIATRNKYNKGEVDSLDSNKELYEDFKEQYNSQEIKTFGKYKGEKYSTVNNETTFKIFLKFLFLIIICIICLLCYFKSDHTGEALVPVGMQDISLFELISRDNKFPFRFLLKSLASSIIGVETFDYAINFNTINENMIFLVGFIYLLIMVFTIVVMVVRKFIKTNDDRNIFDINTYRNIFPYMFIVLGAANYLLVFLARYAFARDEYGMSSRYGIQYMFLTIGIILIFALFVDDIVYNKKYIKKEKDNLKLPKSYLKRKEELMKQGKIQPEKVVYKKFYIVMGVLCIICTAIFTIGHLTTTMDEIFKADYRKIVYDNLVNVAKEYEAYSDEDLANNFEYHRGTDSVRKALTILKEQDLNVFSNKKELVAAK